MSAIRNSLPVCERFSRRTPAAQQWLGWSRTVVSCVLLLSFLTSIVMPTQYGRRPEPTGSQATVCAPHDAETLLDYLVDNCLEPVENVPDEEGDSNEVVELAKDFLADETATPRFGRIFLSHLAYAELTPRWLRLSLGCFSPPPESVSPFIFA